MAVPFEDDETITWFVFYSCDQCGYASIGEFSIKDLDGLLSRYEESREQSYRGDDIQKRVLSAVNWHADRMSPECEWYPVMPIGKEFEEVPQHIADAASEAYACFSIRSYRAAILMARSVLEACAKDKGVTKGSLASKIDALADKGVIGPQIQAEAHEIRYLGNDMAHGDFVAPVSEDDADDVLGFLSTFLNYVYQMPAAIRRRQEARRERGANPNA